jgi:hypothetical protein
MLSLSQTLTYYKRPEIQKALVESVKQRELAIRYNDYFGKRPDTLEFKGDVLEAAKQGASSFHVSEELWSNPLHLGPELKKADMQALRAGWDLVLDIDCKVWMIAKIVTWLLVTSLQDHGITSLSVKFSGNKGFHIAVPFEAFPSHINGQESRLLFPEAARAIALYLLDYITQKHLEIKEDRIVFGTKFSMSFEKLKQVTGKSQEEITQVHCASCHTILKEKIFSGNKFFCPGCEKTTKSEKRFLQCSKCGKLMEQAKEPKALCGCGGNKTYSAFNPLSIIEVDTILISSRHLYRAPYSLHEKSGLASIPLSLENILSFEKEHAKPSTIKEVVPFIDREKVVLGEATELFSKALACMQEKEKKANPLKPSAKKFEELTEAVPEDLFPPCMKLGLKGLPDGKKRFMFMLVNFLSCAGWSHDEIEQRVNDWNAKNPDPIRQTIINGHLRNKKQQKTKVLPPNCANQMYYKDLRVCQPDGLCARIKNPVHYVRRRAFALQKHEPLREKLTDEQKKMRLEHRRRLKALQKKTEDSQ